MARLNEEGQWIVLMGLLVAIGMFFLALIINQSALVGQTTAESVLEFPKSDIRDLRSEMDDLVGVLRPLPSGTQSTVLNVVRDDISALSLARKNAVVDFSLTGPEDVAGVLYYRTEFHYNNGVTAYDETAYF